MTAAGEDSDEDLRRRLVLLLVHRGGWLVASVPWRFSFLPNVIKARSPYGENINSIARDDQMTRSPEVMMGG